MSNDVVKYAFVAGEISPTLFGRTDLTKYDLAVAEGQNWFVDYRGGLSSRPGFEYIGSVLSPEFPTRMFSFSFSPDLSNTYILFFGHEYIRFIQDGGYVLTVGDAIYTLASPYSGADLAGLTAYQYRDLVRLTHKDHPVRNLIRNDHDDWELVEETFSPDLDGPTITSGTGITPDGMADPPELAAEVVFTVTQVNLDGDESVNGNLYKVTNILNYTVTEGSVTIFWNREDEAVSYNVYRSIVASVATLYEGTELGYVGTTRGTTFTDSNILPDFTKQPSVKNNPFEPGRILRVQITDGGSGYTEFATTVGITDPTGTGFEGQTVVNEAGEIVNVIVKNPGSGYTAPEVTFAGGGSDAEATATPAPLTGTYPALSVVFQQRQVYAATENQPITVWGSRYKRFSNFDSSNLVLDNDSYEFDLDTQAIAPIRHMLSSRGGLLLFTQENIWLLNGGGQGNALTPTNALADPQTYSGITLLPPLTVESDILFREGRGYAVRLLSYSEITKSYGGEDKSILANHLFSIGKDIIAWCYQESPFKCVWAVREDGTLLCFTIVKSEDVYAWTPCSTRGKFVDVISIREGQTDRVYATTERIIGGATVKFVERMSLRDFVNVEDAWCVDAALSLTPTYPDATLILHETDGVWEASASAAVFTGSVGYYLRAAQGIFKVIALFNPSLATLQMFEPPINMVAENGPGRSWPVASGDWTLDEPTDTLSGLDHLEGETVSILGDGNVFPQQVVTDGTVVLDHAVTRAIVGLGYRCRAKSLPVLIPDAGIEAKRKRIVGLGLRLDRSRGLKNGRSLESLYEMRDRTTEPMGRPTRLINGFKYQMISSSWDESGQTYFVLDDPLPATILSLVFDAEVGDDEDRSRT